MRYPRLLLASLASAAVVLAAAACSTSTSTAAPSASSCTITVGAVTTNVSAAATTGTIPVTAATGCAWTAVSSASFVTVTSGSSGTANGTVGYSIAANTGATRSASLSIGSNVINFVQSGALAPVGCTVTLSSTIAQINSGGGTADITVTAASTCGWTAASNSSFLTATANASGNGTVTITATANNGAARTGTVTIGGQTVTVSQDAGIVAAFNLFDPNQTALATNECFFRSAVVVNITCTLQSTSFTFGATPIVNYAWSSQYTYGTVKLNEQNGPSASSSFTDTCGLAGSTADGAIQPLTVTLTVTDARGNTATARAGSGNQPAMDVRLFTCGS